MKDALKIMPLIYFKWKQTEVQGKEQHCWIEQVFSYRAIFFQLVLANHFLYWWTAYHVQEGVALKVMPISRYPRVLEVDVGDIGSIQFNRENYFYFKLFSFFKQLFSRSIAFVYKQLNVKTVLFQINHIV